MNNAEKVHLLILAGCVRRALFAIAHKRYDDARGRIKEAIGYSDIAKHAGTEQASLFAPGAKFHLSWILSKFDLTDTET